MLGVIPRLKGITPKKALEDQRSAFAEAYPDRVSRLVLDAVVWTGEGSPTLAERRKKIDQWTSSNMRKVDRAFFRSIFERDHPDCADPVTVEAFADAILAVAYRHPRLDAALIGRLRQAGAEVVLA